MAHVQDIRSFHSTRTPQQRMATIAIVACIHIAVITAFVVALNPTFTNFTQPGPFRLIPEKQVAPPRTKPDVPNPTFIKPSTPTLLPPVVSNTDQQGHSAIAPNAPATGGTASPPGDVFIAAHGILSTHTTPIYPPLAVRLNETGNVLLKLSIDASGTVVDATVEHSSGYADLDDTAVAWVTAHWRYQPATRDGQAVAATTDAIVTFKLTGR